jgi:hypothetical protein
LETADQEVRGTASAAADQHHGEDGELYVYKVSDSHSPQPGIFALSAADLLRVESWDGETATLETIYGPHRGNSGRFVGSVLSLKDSAQKLSKK